MRQADDVDQMLRSFETLAAVVDRFSGPVLRALEAAVAACGRSGRIEGQTTVVAALLRLVAGWRALPRPRPLHTHTHTHTPYLCADAMRIYETMLDRGAMPSVQLKRILVDVCGLDKLSVMLSGTSDGK